MVRQEQRHREPVTPHQERSMLLGMLATLDRYREEGKHLSFVRQVAKISKRELTFKAANPERWEEYVATRAAQARVRFPSARPLEAVRG